MLAEFTAVLALVGLTVLAPGIGLLLLARFGFSRSLLAATGSLRRTAYTLGLTLVVLAAILILYLMSIALSGPRSGSLGSMGNPLGALLVLGYVFVVAPLAAITSATVGIIYLVQRRRANLA